jgi:predicted transcriptional regulator
VYPIFLIKLFKLQNTPYGLGHLESKVMEILWSRTECSVREVVDRLPQPLAYTTVMTTLDRLFKKGMLERRKAERAFCYKPSLSKNQLEMKRADTLISCLVDAAGSQDAALLDDLENKIRLKRMELEKRRKP